MRYTECGQEQWFKGSPHLFAQIRMFLMAGTLRFPYFHKLKPILFNIHNKFMVRLHRIQSSEWLNICWAPFMLLETVASIISHV